MRGKLSLLFLALFVALDIVLVTMAFRHTSAPSAAAPDVDPDRAAAATPSPADQTSSPPPTATGGSSPGGGATFLDLGPSGGPVLSATRGDCDDGVAPVVTVARSGTATARERTPDDLSEVLRVTAGSDGLLTVVGRTLDCKVATWSSGDVGRSWSQKTGAPASWYLAPSPTASAVFSPAGRRQTPCPPTGLSTVGDDVVRLLCDDGRVLGTSDGGDTWVPLGRLEDATAIRFTTPGDGLALAAVKGCSAAVMRTTDGGTSWDQKACLGEDEPLAIAAEGDLAVAQVGSRLLVSEDGGVTWPDASG